LLWLAVPLPVLALALLVVLFCSFHLLKSCFSPFDFYFKYKNTAIISDAVFLKLALFSF
jgi:hypothetical protein